MHKNCLLKVGGKKRLLIKLILNLLTISEIQTSRIRELLLALVRTNRSSGFLPQKQQKSCRLIMSMPLARESGKKRTQIPNWTMVTWQLTNLTTSTSASIPLELDRPSKLRHRYNYSLLCPRLLRDGQRHEWHWQWSRRKVYETKELRHRHYQRSDKYIFHSQSGTVTSSRVAPLILTVHIPFVFILDDGVSPGLARVGVIDHTNSFDRSVSFEFSS